MSKLGIASNSTLDELFNSVDLSWNTYDWKQDSIAQKISMWRPNAKGAATVFPIHNVSSTPVELQLGADRQFAGPQIFKITVDHKVIVPKASMEVYMPELQADMYDVLGLQNMANDVIMGARNIWRRELAQVMLANPLAFDGLSFYNTAHPANQYDTGLGTYSNDLSNLDLDETGLASAIQALATAPALDGQVDANRLQKVIIVVPTMQLYYKAMKLVALPAGSLIPQNGTVAGTSVGATSPFAVSPFGFEVIWIPELYNPAVPATAKQWYLVAGSSIGSRAFATSVVQPPMPAYEGADRNEHLRVLKLAIRITWDAYGGVGVGLPMDSVRVTLP